jgi:RHS repeat-associated protein
MYNLANQPLPSATWHYDAAGNLLSDALGNSCAWDGDERMSSCNGISYFYDAEGNRVGKGGAVATDVIYFGGRPMGRYSNGSWTDLLYGTGVLLAEAPGTQVSTAVYRLADHQGSTIGQRSSTNQPVGSIQDYGPYGELFNGSNTSDPYKFTGKERDSESGNDYFGARYFASSMGRFISPDHPFVDQHPDDPQSWNLYAYARNNPLINIDPTGLGCITDLGQGSDANHEKVEFNNSINSDDCAGQHGTWVPGDVSANNTGAYRGDDGSINFQATTNTDGNVYYSSFRSGAQTDEDGTCLNGCQGASIAHAPTDWLSSQIAGGSLPGLMSFAANRFEPRRDGGLMALLAGPGFSPDAPDNWAGPGGMGTPQGQGDWAAMAHDYNYHTNGITLSTYFNPFVSRATAKALIQSDNYLIGHAGGAQAVKMGMFFGVVNAFQWAFHPYF